MDSIDALVANNRAFAESLPAQHLDVRPRRRLAIVKADRDGIVIGRAEAPLVNSGDAIVHIASTDPGPPGTPDEGLQDPADDYGTMDVTPV